MGLCGRPRPLRLLVVLEAVLLCTLVVHAAVPALRGSLPGVFDNGIYDATEILAVVLAACGAAGARVARGAWTLVSGALASWTAADVYYGIAFGSSGAPGVSICDAGYLLFYVLLGAGLFLLVRGQLGGQATLAWKTEALGLALAIGALALVWLDPALDNHSGSIASVVVNSAYPILDVGFLSCLAVLATIGGARARRTWAPVGAALLTLVVADSLYLVATAHGTYVQGRLLDVLWPAGMAMLAVASLRPAVVQAAPAEAWAPAFPGTTVLAAAIAFGSACIALAFGHDRPALGAAVAALVVVLARECTLGFRQAQQLRRAARHALTDDLTKLGNRRRFLAEAESLLRAKRAPTTLVLLDLDRFKRHNDRCGHAAGDALLVAFAAELRGTFGRHAYRLGGDEFCVLTDEPPEAVAARLAAPASLEESSVSVSFGTAILGGEASTVSEALELADRRLYERKAARRRARSGRDGGIVVVSFAPQRQSQLVRIAAALELGRVDVVARSRDLEPGPAPAERAAYDAAIVDVRDFDARAAVRCLERLQRGVAATRVIVIGSLRDARTETARRLFAAGATGYVEVADAVSEAELTLRIRSLVFAELVVVDTAPAGPAPSEPRHGRSIRAEHRVA